MNLLANLAYQTRQQSMRYPSMLQRSVQQYAAAFSNSVSNFTWEKPFLTSNKFVLIQNPLDRLPFI
jgi:hypothetical protein